MWQFFCLGSQLYYVAFIPPRGGSKLWRIYDLFFCLKDTFGYSETVLRLIKVMTELWLYPPAQVRGDACYVIKFATLCLRPIHFMTLNTITWYVLPHVFALLVPKPVLFLRYFLFLTNYILPSVELLDLFFLWLYVEKTFSFPSRKSSWYIYPIIFFQLFMNIVCTTNTNIYRKKIINRQFFLSTSEVFYKYFWGGSDVQKSAWIF